MIPIDSYLQDDLNCEYTDITVQTSLSEYATLVLTFAADLIYSNKQLLSSDHLVKLVGTIVDMDKLYVQEHVTIERGTISVYLNVLTTSKDSDMWKAVDLVAQAMDTLQTSDGTVYFGDKLMFSEMQVLKFLQ